MKFIILFFALGLLACNKEEPKVVSVPAPPIITATPTPAPISPIVVKALKKEDKKEVKKVSPADEF